VCFADGSCEPVRRFGASFEGPGNDGAIGTDLCVGVDGDPVDSHTFEFAHGVDHGIGSPRLTGALAGDGHTANFCKLIGFVILYNLCGGGIEKWGGE